MLGAHTIFVIGMIHPPIQPAWVNTREKIASTYADAFKELLDTYEHIGENLPLLLQYENLFHSKPYMLGVLSLMYEDILKFHHIALKYFQQPR